MMHKTTSQQDEAACWAWREVITINFSKQFLFLGEPGKDGHTLYRHFGHARRGVHATEVTPLQCGEHWSILPALSLDSYAVLRVVKGAIDGARFYDFVVNKVVSGAFSGFGSCLSSACRGFQARHRRLLIVTR
ncbi:hypothetical protein PAXRUDRAFT_832975 [Paxillus rubicundulus Ve08.2h10]|uniref:Uncharacterized protein n=1 Tax=Paxillus rubicundulus Ve08.2h10 TaxID=930991 RepID=A0A0D0DB44_9AGAM|nr:hypothetical protein PAXRUDRAFT_832975 [Paxillus rubicundulus Ve08.2h10]